MTVLGRIQTAVNHKDFTSYLIGLTLGLVLVGYAPSSIGLGVFLFFAVREIIVHKYRFRFDWALILPMLFYFWCCLSFLWSVDQEQTSKGIGRFVIFLLVPFFFSFLPKVSLRSFNVVLNTFTVSNVILGAFFLVTAFFRYLEVGKLSAFTYHDLVLVLDLNAIYVSVFFCVSYFFVLAKSLKKTWDYWFLLLLGILIFLLSSKMIISVFILGNIGYFFIFKGFSSLKSPKFLIFSFLVIIVLSFVSKEVIQRVLVEKTTDLEEVLTKEKFNQVYLWTGTSIRILQLRNLKGQIEEDQIFWKGFGLYASRDNLVERHLAFNTWKGFHTYNYHNLYAQILAELGIFALLAFLFMLGIGIKKAIQNKHFFMFMFFFLMTMIFLTESVLWVHRGLFLFVILYTVLNKLDFSEFKV